MDRDSCPNCGKQFRITPEMMGKAARCPACGQTFKIGEVVITTPPPPPPIEFNLPESYEFSGAHGPHFTPGSGGFESIRTAARTIVRNRFQPAKSIWDLVLDWKFERYVTVMVVRVTWLLWVVTTGLCILTIYIDAVIDLDSGSKSRRVTREWDEPRAVFRLSDTAKDLIYRNIAVAACLYALLWVRVLLESVIVIFNIATTLGRIENLLADRR